MKCLWEYNSFLSSIWIYHIWYAKCQPFCLGLSVVAWWYGAIGSSNDLLLDGTKPLPEPVMTNHQWVFMVLNSDLFHKQCSGYWFLKWVWNICLFTKLLPHLSGANEFQECLVLTFTLQVLTESEQMRKEADDTGPMAEVEHWRQLNARFNSIVDQIKERSNRNIITILHIAKSKVLKVKYFDWTDCFLLMPYGVPVLKCLTFAWPKVNAPCGPQRL